LAPNDCQLPSVLVRALSTSTKRQTVHSIAGLAVQLLTYPNLTFIASSITNSDGIAEFDNVPLPFGSSFEVLATTDALMQVNADATNPLVSVFTAQPTPDLIQAVTLLARLLVRVRQEMCVMWCA
jgi:hypothetical protein